MTLRVALEAARPSLPEDSAHRCLGRLSNAMGPENTKAAGAFRQPNSNVVGLAITVQCQWSNVQLAVPWRLEKLLAHTLAHKSLRSGMMNSPMNSLGWSVAP